ncbi:hypothetical protein Tco_0588739, partial [Tanacetum coccineum]
TTLPFPIEEALPVVKGPLDASENTLLSLRSEDPNFKIQEKAVEYVRALNVAPLEVVFARPVDEVRSQFSKFSKDKESVENVLSATKFSEGGNSHSVSFPYHLECKVNFEGVGNVTPWATDVTRRKRVKCYVQGSGRRKRKKFILRGNEICDREALVKLLQMGTISEYQSEFEILLIWVMRISEFLLKLFYIFGLKPALQRVLLRSRPTTLGETFSLARISEARFEDERSTTTIANPNDLNIAIPDQVLEESPLHMSNKVEAIKTSIVATSGEHEQRENQDDQNEISKEKHDAKPPISADTFGSNGGTDSETSGPETLAMEIVDNGIESEVVVDILKEFQKGDMVDALSRVEQKNEDEGEETMDEYNRGLMRGDRRSTMVGQNVNPCGYGERQSYRVKAGIPNFVGNLDIKAC